MTFISVIIPFNKTIRYLEDCLNSLDNQDMEDNEVIIVLNGIEKNNIADETSELISRYEKLNIKVKSFADEINVSKARNEGIELASGKYVYFIDSDDYIYEDGLDKLVRIAKESDGDFVNGEIINTNYIKDRFEEELEKGEEIRVKKDDLGDTELALRLVVLKHNNDENLLTSLHALIKKEILENNNIRFDEDKKYYSDYSFILKVIKECNNFKSSTESLYGKRERDDMINSPSLRQELKDDKFEYSINEYENIMGLINSYEDNDKKEFLKNEINDKLLNFYLNTLSKQCRSSKNKKWRTSYIDKLSKIAKDFHPKWYNKREISSLIKNDKKSLNKQRNFRLAIDKFKKMLTDKEQIYRTIYYNILKKMSLKENRICFISFRGDFYTDSPKYIYQYLKDEYKDKYEYIWIINDNKIKIPGNVKKVKRFSIKYYYYLASSKYFVTNGRQPFKFSKRDNQVILSTWHGTPLKRIGLDIGNIYSNSPTIKRTYIKNASEWDYLISPNHYTSEILKNAFAYDKDVLETGYPRNDILYNADEDKIKQIKEDLKLPDNKKIILYAPTWRDDDFYEQGQYKFKLKLNLDKLKEEISDEYIILIRTHYFISDQLDLTDYQDFAFDVSKYDDIAELYLISDILITDYSSVFFDYANLKRPILFFTYDLDKYENVLRGFYINIRDEVPGPLIFTNDELINKIKHIEDVKKDYKDKYETFYKKFCNIDDGNATKRIVDIVWNQDNS